MRKRIAAVLLTLCLLLPAALSARAGGNLVLTLSREEARVGDWVNVTLSIENNPGIISLQGKVVYDPEKLELVAVKDGGILGSEIRHQEALTSPYVLSWENYTAPENFTADGVVCTLTFRVLSGEPGESLPVTLDVGDYGVMNFDLQDLARKVEYGSVTVVEGKGFSLPLIDRIAPLLIKLGFIPLAAIPALSVCLAALLVALIAALPVVILVLTRRRKGARQKGGAS